MDVKAFEWLNKNQLSYDIWNKKYRYEDEDFDDWLDRISNKNKELKKVIYEKKFLFGGRILANRGLQKDHKITFSNCYVIPPVKDSIEDIYHSCSQLARTYSYGGGCGVDISNLRPCGAEVHNAAKTTSGAVSFMSSFDEVTKVIGQNGRRGALMISIDINHPDVYDFVNIKTDLNKVTSANISVRVNKDFMEAVKTDKDYILKFPCDVEIPHDLAIEDMPYNQLWTYSDITDNNNLIYFKKIKAKELFNTLCYNNWNYAEPGILYWDNISNYNLLEFDDNFEYAGVNPCAEEPLPAGGSCLLGSINLAEFVNEYGDFNYNDFYRVIGIAVEALNDVLDEGLSLHPLKIQQQTVGDYRQIGLGVFGYADMLIKMGLRYGSEEANIVTDIIARNLATWSIHKSALLAKERGAYKMWDPAVMKSEFFNEHIDEYTDTYNLVKKYGLRNSQLLTIAPTGTLSTMFNVSGGAEPIFAKSFNRTTKSLHDEDVTYTVHPTIIQEYLEKSGKTLKDADDYIVSSEDIAPIDRVKVQSVWQKHIDASISSTVNLPKHTTVEDVKDIYMSAYEYNLKGITIFRSGCARSAILVDTKDTHKETEKIDPERGYIKRPKEIKADYHQVKIKGETFIVLVGKVNDKPYEIFTFRPNDSVKLPPHTGTITKVKKMHYSFKSEYLEIPDLQASSNNIEEHAATLYTSMLLRHNTNIKYVIKTARKVNENISSFSSAMCRILSKYIPSEVISSKCPDCNGNLIRENGCIHCESCGWSKCE